MIANIDENMGEMDAFLRETGLRDNTIFIFLTDNGTSQGHNVFNAGMRGHKRSYYDGGHRVPCFIRWPAAGRGLERGLGTRLLLCETGIHNQKRLTASRARGSGLR